MPARRNRSERCPLGAPFPCSRRGRPGAKLKRTASRPRHRMGASPAEPKTRPDAARRAGSGICADGRRRTGRSLGSGRLLWRVIAGRSSPGLSSGGLERGRLSRLSGVRLRDFAALGRRCRLGAEIGLATSAGEVGATGVFGRGARLRAWPKPLLPAAWRARALARQSSEEVRLTAAERSRRLRLPWRSWTRSAARGRSWGSEARPAQGRQRRPQQAFRRRRNPPP